MLAFAGVSLFYAAEKPEKYITGDQNRPGCIIFGSCFPSVVFTARWRRVGYLPFFADGGTGMRRPPPKSFMASAKIFVRASGDSWAVFHCSMKLFIIDMPIRLPAPGSSATAWNRAKHISSVVSLPKSTRLGGELGLKGFVAELS
jgi:hypothetical protein